MRHLLTILIALALAAPLSAQQKKATAAKKPAAASTKKPAAAKKTSPQPKARQPQKSQPSISGLKNQRTQVQRKIQEQEKLLRANKADVKKRLNDLLAINTEIDQKRKTIDDIQKDITGLEDNISLLKAQLSTLEQQLDERKSRYIKSMRYLARHRSVQDHLMFIFSTSNLAQMYRRLRFVRQYAAFQRAQGQMVKNKQEQVQAKHNELSKAKGQKDHLLSKGRQEHAALQGKQAEQQNVVKTLQKQQKTIQGIIAEQKKKDAELNAQIDRLVAEEVARARARAEAEAKRKAAAEAKRKADELARKKAAAEAAARENERKIAQAKEREAQAKAAAREAAGKPAAEKERAERAARTAEAEREAVERKARVDNERNKKEVERARSESNDIMTLSSEDRHLSNNFSSNRGRLPIPITGPYKIVSHFGQYDVEGLSGVRLDNKGINIKGNPGAQARCIFDGEVSAVVNVGGTMLVIVRHGSYISVYCNLKSVSVHKGQKVSTRQSLGSVGTDNILQFQLRREKEKLNPESWLGR